MTNDLAQVCIIPQCEESMMVKLTQKIELCASVFNSPVDIAPAPKMEMEMPKYPKPNSLRIRM
jgi:hypothetical protein